MSESPTPPPSASADRPTRQVGLDVTRGLAVAGMALVNFDIALGVGGGPAWLAALIESVQGRASALFVVLAGVGIGLLVRSRGEGARTSVARRGVVLFVGGLALLTLWPADILHFYGVWFLLASLCLGLAPRTYVVLAALVTLLFPALLVLGVDYERHWNFETLEYTDLWTADGLVRHLVFNGFHPTVPWFAFLLAGLALSRRLTDPSRSTLPVALFAGAIALATELAARRWSAVAGTEVGPLVDTASIPPGPPYMVAAGATAVAVLALCVHVCRAPSRTRVTGFVRDVLAAAGRAALSLYVLHVVLGIVPMFVLTDEARGPRLDRVEVTQFWLAWCGSFFLAAWWWIAKRGRAGPFEALFRKLAP